jgi:SAM-dependent methyltransferase
MISFNCLASPSEWDGNGPLRDQHPLVTEEILQGQHPIRAWEYSLALRALEHSGWDFNESRGLLFADIGGSGSNFWRTLTRYTSKPITAVDPNHVWSSQDEAALFFRDTLARFKKQEPTKQFDAVFCLSVIEHVPSDDLRQFEKDLCSLVKPGGLLVLTCDAAESHPDVFHFNWMRERIYTPGGLAALHVVLAGSHGMQPLTPPEYRWEGPTVYDYSVASLVLTKKG